MSRITTLLIFLSTYFVLPISSQIPLMRNFTPLDYGLDTQNWNISVDKGGMVFFANNGGLLSFDGDEWRSEVMPNFTSVRSVLAIDEKEAVVVGATNEFGYFKIDKISKSVKYTSLSAQLAEKVKSFGEIWNIRRNGNTFLFQGKNDLFIFNGFKFRKRLHFKYGIENIFIVSGVTVVSTTHGIFLLKKGKLTTAKGFSQLWGKKIRGIFPYKNMWLIVTEKDATFLYDGYSCTPLITSLTTYLRTNYVFCSACDGNYIAYGTVRGGLVIQNMKTGGVTYANVLTGLQNNTVLSLYFDGMGSLWAGLDIGISYIMISMPFRNIFGLSNNIGTGYASVLIGKRLYLGTNQGLFAITYPLKPEPVPVKPNSVHGIIGQIWCTRKIGNDLLCGNNDGAFYVKDMKATKIAGPIGTWNFISLKNHPGYVLGCDYKSFFLLKKVGEKYVMCWRLKGFNESSGNFIQDADESIWLSQWMKGIYRLTLSNDLKRVVKVEYFHKGKGLLIDDNNLVTKIDGNAYISSVNGFLRYDPKTRELVLQNWLNKVFNTFGTSLRINETPAGDLWAYKPDYLAIAHKLGYHKYRAFQIPLRNAIRKLQMSLGHLGYIGNNYTLLNATSGFYIVRNDMPRSIENKRNVFIRSVTSFNNGDSTLYLHSFDNSPSTIIVPHSMNSLRISFVMPEFRDGKAVTYQCWLEGLDKKWSTNQINTFKEYTHLPKGRYTFHVRATDNVSGQKCETSMQIVVRPAWYDSWIAYIVYAIIAVIILCIVYLLMQRRAHNIVERLKREKERQLHEQEEKFEHEKEKKEHELTKLRADKLEMELKHKSSELADSTINLIRKNDILNNIDEGMKELYESVSNDEPADQKRKIQQIRHGIQENIREDDNWDRFEENFNMVYDNFMKKLITRFPNLKKNDLKLCAYLKMGLSSKEMASLLNTNLRSVETARYRLRKKLGLGSGDNLTNFIQNLDKDSE